MRTTTPVPSRTVVGPNSGTNRYGPCGNPQTPNVWPKSSLPRSMPIIDARSKMPPRPKPVLSTTRPRSSPNLSSLPCSRPLTAENRSSMLLKTFETPVRIELRDDVDVGLRHRLHDGACRRRRAPRTARGSSARTDRRSTAPPRSRRAARRPGPAARARDTAVAVRSRQRSFPASRRGLVEQELADQLFEDDRRLRLRHACRRRRASSCRRPASSPM